MEQAIENNDIQSVRQIIEEGCFCEEYYLILAARKCSLELFQLLEGHMVNPKELYNICLEEAIKGYNIDIINYLINDNNIKLYNFSVLADIESEDIWNLIDSKRHISWISTLNEACVKGNLKFLIWYRKKYSWPPHIHRFFVQYKYYHIIKYEHDNKLGTYANNNCNNECIYCNMNKMSIIWNSYRERGSCVDWLSRNIVESIEKKLILKREQHLGEIGFTGSIGLTGVIGPIVPIDPVGPVGIPYLGSTNMGFTSMRINPNH